MRKNSIADLYLDQKSSMIATGSNKYPFQLAIYLGPSARLPPNGACQPRDIPSVPYLPHTSRASSLRS